MQSLDSSSHAVIIIRTHLLCSVSLVLSMHSIELLKHCVPQHEASCVITRGSSNAQPQAAAGQNGGCGFVSDGTHSVIDLSGRVSIVQGLRVLY